MNSASDVNKLVAGWLSQGLPASEIIVKTATAEIGWCYVWGATGQKCTPAGRKQYANRSSCPAAEAAVTLGKCQVCNGYKSSCAGCKYYPDGRQTLMDDCQGFVKQISSRVGIHYKGGGATSMWNDNSNWSAKGTIDTLPRDKVCCVFWKNGSKMSHVGFYTGDGYIIHCSGEVKREKIPKRATHWAMPKGLEGGTPMKPTLRRGDKGEYVTLAQTELIQKGYDCGSFGADGQFGTGTEKAVRAFQKDHTDQNGNPLKVDGVIGPSTWWALDQVSPEPMIKYTVTIPHLSYTQAEELLKQYPGSTKTEERGDSIA